MKRILSILLTCALGLCLLTACGGGKTSGSGSGSSGGGGDTFTTDLSKFYDDAVAKASESGDFPMMMPLEDDMLESFYPGLTDIERSQTVANMAAISAVSCEIILVEVKNASDVKAVQDIFQTRIDTVVADQMQYPETIEVWKNNAQVVTRGNCVCLFVMNPDFGDFAADFNAL